MRSLKSSDPSHALPDSLPPHLPLPLRTSTLAYRCLFILGGKAPYIYDDVNFSSFFSPPKLNSLVFGPALCTTTRILTTKRPTITAHDDGALPTP